MDPIFLHNYHSHTKRCGHAEGEDEEYVLAAIANGFKTIGFSDHVILPGVDQKRMRGSYDQLEDYIASVLSLKAKYKGQIDVKLAFECEYFHDSFSDYYRELLSERGFEYLILGQHCCYDRMFNAMIFYGDIVSRRQRLEQYTKDLIDGMRSGLFLYVAHPDLFLLFYRQWDEHAENAARKICKTAEQLRIPLELNMGRTRGSHRIELWDENAMIYPYPKFWEIVSQYNIDVVVGVDAHSPKDYFDSDYAAFAEILKKMNLKYRQKLPV